MTTDQSTYARQTERDALVAWADERLQRVRDGAVGRDAFAEGYTAALDDLRAVAIRRGQSA